MVPVLPPLLLAAFVLLLVLVGLVLLGWKLSNRFLVPKPYSLMPEFRILKVEVEAGGPAPATHPRSAPQAAGEMAEEATETNDCAGCGCTVFLPVPERVSQFSDVGKDGIYNLLWNGGYGRLGPVLREEDSQVARRLEEVHGRMPESGDEARLDAVVFRRDPLQDHGIPFTEVELEGETGTLRAWWVERPGRRAVLALHGRRRADRTDVLRILPTLTDAGWSVLALAYRNHDTSAAGSDGLYHYGASEANDALVAVDELGRRGVQEVVLYGFSMGGAVALRAAQLWTDQQPRIAGLVLDSPLIDPRTVIRERARALSPFFARVIDLALLIASVRTGVDWRALDQRRHAGAIRQPLLLFAGTDDSTIPIDLVDEFAAEVVAPLDYRRLPGVEHVEAWNQDPSGYEEAVRSFLATLPARADSRPSSG